MFFVVCTIDIWYFVLTGAQAQREFGKALTCWALIRRTRPPTSQGYTRNAYYIYLSPYSGSHICSCATWPEFDLWPQHPATDACKAQP